MPPHHLSRRAQNKVAGWIGILIIVILGTATLFCIIVGILVCRRKRARKQRERKMTEEQTRPFVTQAYDGGAHAQEHSTHRYYEAEGQRGVELESNASVPVELQGEVGTAPQIQRHEVPATSAHDVSPIEMPAHAAVR
jgi:flagellar biosynthesis/type III secretory pathway M-ring protein FliF/YscJ